MTGAPCVHACMHAAVQPHVCTQPPSTTRRGLVANTGWAMRTQPRANRSPRHDTPRPPQEHWTGGTLLWPTGEADPTANGHRAMAAGGTQACVHACTHTTVPARLGTHGQACVRACARACVHDPGWSRAPHRTRRVRAGLPTGTPDSTQPLHHACQTSPCRNTPHSAIVRRHASVGEGCECKLMKRCEYMQPSALTRACVHACTQAWEEDWR